MAEKTEDEPRTWPVEQMIPEAPFDSAEYLDREVPGYEGDEGETSADSPGARDGKSPAGADE